MAAAYIGSVMTTGTTHSATIDTTACDLIVLCLGEYSTDISTITDTQSNTWVNDVGTYDAVSGLNHTVRIYYCINPSKNASHSFWTTGGSNQVIAALVFSGSDTGQTQWDVRNGMSALNQTTFSPGSMTPGAANEILVCVGSASFAGGITFSIGAPYTQVQTRADGGGFVGFTASYSLTASGATNPTITASAQCGDVAASQAAFKVAGGGGATFYPRPGLNIRQAVNRAGTY